VNLVRAELERLTARRFVRLMVILLLLAFVVTAGTTLASSHQPTAAELSSAQLHAAEQRRNMEDSYQRCLAVKQGSATPRDGDYYPVDCSEVDPAQQDRLPVAADFLTGVFTFAQQARPLLYFLVAFLVLFGFLVGASYIGADLNSGGVVNLLLWRPQRLSVLGAKLGTLLGAVLLLGVLASAAYLATFWLIGQTAGQPGRLDPEFWSTLAATWGRGMALVLLASALGFAIAALGRHTAAALGTVAAYVVVWEGGARLVMEMLDVGRPEQWMLTSYLASALAGQAQFYDRYACTGQEFGSCGGMYTLTWAPSLLLLAGVAGLITVAAFVGFRRRDLI
jgi:ABC-2 type transport system permease protein